MTSSNPLGPEILVQADVGSQSAVDRLMKDHGAKFLRYSGVSVVTIGIGQILLFVLHGMLDQPAWSANLVAVAVSAVPGYVLNRYFVWGKRSPNSALTEMLPFWGLAFLGLVVSTAAVAVVSARWDNTAAVLAAYLAAFGALWLFKYGVFERWLFGPSTNDQNRGEQT